MPITPTYPGVYIEELPSGVCTITGVATSITAFIGRALRGPVNDPITINSFTDFERTFGGLWIHGPLGFAVRDFFQNGGGQAVIVRLYHPFFPSDAELDAALAAAQMVAAAAAASAEADPADVAAEAREAADDPANAGEPRHSAADKVAAAAVAVAAPVNRARLSVGTLNLEAASPGAWGNQLRARIDTDIKGADAANLFNLSVKDLGTGDIEVFRNVSVLANHARNVTKVLEQESRLVRTRGALPLATPTPSNPAPKGIVPAGQDPFAAGTSSGVTTQASDGSVPTSSDYTGSETNKTGLFALVRTDLFNLLCIPPYSPTQDVETSVWSAAAAYCEKRRAMLLVDAPSAWTSKDAAKGDGSATGVAALGTSSKNAAVFFPRLRQPNPLHDNQLEAFVPCGAVAGVVARTDAQRGVWKAPAGLDATLVGVPQLSVSLTDAENGELNPLGVNCLRAMPAAGRVVWGARTLQGDDRLASEWKYLPVRRMALFLEESLYRGTQWVVFEPNDEPLWAQIRLNLGAFMQGLFRQGAFQGKTPAEAYFVKCDKETTTQTDINLGIVNIVVGFAPLKPAEFVIIKIQQMAGHIPA